VRARDGTTGGGATLTRRGAQIQGYPTREGGSDKSIGDNRMTRAEYDGDNPLRLADEIDAALTKYGLGSDRRICKAIHFFEGELHSSLNACAVPARRRSQSSRLAALTEWPDRKKLRNTLSSLTESPDARPPSEACTY
jgi:hypothetical protein